MASTQEAALHLPLRQSYAFVGAASILWAFHHIPVSNSASISDAGCPILAIFTIARVGNHEPQAAATPLSLSFR
jgi:hypothetical protein